MRNVILFVITILFCSCQERESSETINLAFDVESLKEVNVSELSNVLKLSSDSLVIGTLKRFWIKGEDVMLAAANGIFRFDGTSGKLVNTVSGKGHAKNEYISLWQVMPDGEQLFIHDFDGNKVLRFGMDGTFYSSCATVADNGFQFFVRLNDTVFVGKCGYRGRPGTELALYDENLNYKMSVDDLILNSGLSIGNPLICGTKEVLYMPLFSNKVYSIDHTAQYRLKYCFDFGEYGLDDLERFEDDYNVFSHITESYKAGKRYALAFYLLADNANNMVMSFAYNTDKCIGIYKKSDKVETCLKFVGNDGDKLLDYAISGNVLHILFENEKGLSIYQYEI
ncbi:MAG: 6-bladed beta-propeller [Marinifilaceae bacterium]